MLTQIKGIHHITAMASDAVRNNRFYTEVLGMRRVKKTVNFDAPDVYHLYYANEIGTPGTVMTYFPFPNAGRGKPGAGEVSVTLFSIPPASLDFWKERLGKAGLDVDERAEFGRLFFDGPDGERLALVEVQDDSREAWSGAGVPADKAIRGFYGARFRLNEVEATAALLAQMGYYREETQGSLTRFMLPENNGAGHIEIEADAALPRARQGAGSVHHIAFAVDDRARQLEVREELEKLGAQVTPVIDRDYFFAIYFRTPGGILFEVATNEPGFDRDEERSHLGEKLMLPEQHAHLRPHLENSLPALGN